MGETSAERLISALLGALLAVSSAAPAKAQLEPIQESVDVRVVNVDVVATDRQGKAISGLKREDFRLLVDGAEVPVEYFSAFGAVESTGSDGAGTPEPDRASLPLVIVDYDGRSSGPSAGREALETLRRQLPELLEATRAIMIARQGTTLVIEQRFTRDPELLDGVLTRLIERNEPVRLNTDRTLLIGRLEKPGWKRPPSSLSQPQRAGNGSPLRTGMKEEHESELATAQKLLDEVRSVRRQESHIQRTVVAQLDSLIGSVAGLSGRKAILYLGPGIQPQPAEALLRMWWSRFRKIAGQLGVASIENEMDLDITTRLAGLLEKANASHVAFFGHDSGGVSVQSSLEFENMASATFTEGEMRSAQHGLLSLARGSGGAGRVNSADLGDLLGEMMDGFHNYYSLGFTAVGGFPDQGKVRVKLVNRKGRVRHFDRYVIRSGRRELEELTLAVLLTEAAANPMEIQVEVDPPERQPDGTYVVPLLIKVPIAALTLVPQGGQHMGRVSVVVHAQGEAGELSEPALGVLRLELENERLLTSLGGAAGYRLKMRVSKGEQRIAIGVRDEIAQRDSALRMVIQAGRGS